MHMTARIKLPGLLAAFVLLLGAGSATAQTAISLVSNTGQTAHPNLTFLNFDYAQAFTTGSRSDGYKLTRVDLRMRSGTGTPTYTVRIHSDSSNSPGTSVGTALAQQGTVPSTAGLVRFNAPGAGIDLTADTRSSLLRGVMHC